MRNNEIKHMSREINFGICVIYISSNRQNGEKYWGKERDLEEH